MPKPRVIIDTNILISYLLKPSATITAAVEAALYHGHLLLSQDSFDELRAVTERFVKRGFISVEESSEFLGAVVEVAEWVKILEQVRLCRDPKDDKFLELAINGNAAYLVTGDRDLLTLHPFKTTNILSAQDYIAACTSPPPPKKTET
jgi:putative PIN family toxin of toxin-antitoxin system